MAILVLNCSVAAGSSALQKVDVAVWSAFLSPPGASPALSAPLACGAFLCLIAGKDYSVFYSSFRVLIKIITL